MAVAASSSSSLVDRMLRAARLDSSLYDEVDADSSATSQAWIVVILAAVAAGIGGAIGAAMHGVNPGAAILDSVVSHIVAWVVWTFVMTWVGNTLLGGQATYSRMLRSLGFAYSPIVLDVLDFIPLLGGIIAVIAGIWWLVASFVAVREGLQFSNGKTVGTVILGIIAYGIVSLVIRLILVAIFGAGALATVMGA